MSNPYQLALAIIVGATALSKPLAAVAQDDQIRLEEVVVTAERREQNLQQLAITASAISGQSLEDYQIDVVDDLIKATPALTINDFGVGKSINIRGIGKNVESPGVSAGVAYYVDGVAIPNSIFLNTPFFDLARVEVLRGPQGTLVGMNSTGGALLIVSNDPNPEAIEGSVELSYGDFDNLRFRGMINLPVGDELAFRLAGEHESRDSFFTNLGPAAGEPGKVDRVSLRAAFGGNLSDNLELFIRGEYNESETDGFVGKTIVGDPGGPPNPVPYSILQDLTPADRFSLARDVETRNDSDYYRVSANLSYLISDNLEFRSITGFQDGTRNLLLDADKTTFSVVEVQIDIWEEALSQEFNLIGSVGDHFNWVLGAFYLDLETRGFIEPRIIPLGGAPIVQVFGNSTTENLGVFGQGTFYLSDATSLTLGLRYNDEESTNPGGFLQLFDPPGVATITVPESLLGAKDEAITGKVTLDHQFTENHFGFITVSKGFKGGGTNSAPLAPFDSETVWNYELGWKADFFDGRLRSQFGLFYMEFEDMQRNVFNPVTPELSGISNFGEAEISGVELQLQGQFGGLGLDLAAGYTKSELGNIALVDDRYGSDVPVDLSGRELNYNPEVTFSIGLDYQAELPGGLFLTPRVRYSYTAEQWANIFQVEPTDYIDSRSLVDASLTLDSEAAQWSVELYATNLLDEDWVASKSTVTPEPGRVEFFGAPREYGIRVGYSF